MLVNCGASLSQEFSGVRAAEGRAHYAVHNSVTNRKFYPQVAFALSWPSQDVPAMQRTEEDSRRTATNAAAHPLDAGALDAPRSARNDMLPGVNRSVRWRAPKGTKPTR